MSAPRKPDQAWKFYRAGGVDQVDLSTPDDVERIAELDRKLWVALACPTRGLSIEARSLDLVDTDGDGRIRPPEVLAAIAFARDAFRDRKDLFEGKADVPLASIDDRNDRGRSLLAGARRILSNLGKGDATAISLADLADTEKIFVETKLNGDGVVPPESADDEATRKAIEDVIAVVGSVRDRSGKPGVDEPHVTAFFERAIAWADWLEKADADPGLRPLGDATNAAGEALAAVAAKIDDYFVRCRIGWFDDRIAAHVVPDASVLQVFALRDLESQDEAFGRLPLARPAPGRALPLDEGLNPAWAARMKAFSATAVAGVLGPGRTALTEAEWATLRGRFEPWLAWRAARPADPELQKLDPARIRELARGGARTTILDLVSRDAALAEESNQIENVERMLRLRRDLVPLLRNYVNFSQFYGTRLGIFQVGVLYVDGRSCDLCLGVDDPAKHAALASLAHAYLLYCDCTRRKDAEKRTIVAAVTAGDVDNLMAGRNGVFYDRKGDDWDATVTKVVENPISIKQAFWAPYKRLIRFVEERLAKRAAAADEAASKRLEESAAAAEQEKKPAEKKPAEAAAADEGDKIDIGTVAAIGVAVGGIATFLSSVVATILGLGMWMPVGLAVLLLAVSGPSMLIAWLKLRQRNIGPLLDASGWAVNAFARINVPFGGALTKVAALPSGAKRSLDDPFAEKKRPWRLYVVVAVALVLGILWLTGRVDAYLPSKARVATVLHQSHPSGSEPPSSSAASTTAK